MPIFDDDYEGRYQHTVKIDMPLPDGLGEPSRALFSVSQRDELKHASWNATYDLLPVWPLVAARINSELNESWHIHFEEWGFSPQGSEGLRPPLRAFVDECPGEAHVIAQLSLLFTTTDDGDHDPAGVAIKVMIDKATGRQLDIAVD